MKAKHQSTRQRVKHLMFLDQNYRDDDKLLYLKLAEQDGLILTKQQRAIFLLLPSESIVARRRREFSKLYPASALAKERRHRSEDEFAQEFGEQRWLNKILHRRGIS